MVCERGLNVLLSSSRVRHASQSRITMNARNRDNTICLAHRYRCNAYAVAKRWLPPRSVPQQHRSQSCTNADFNGSLMADVYDDDGGTDYGRSTQSYAFERNGAMKCCVVFNMAGLIFNWSRFGFSFLIDFHAVYGMFDRFIIEGLNGLEPK